MIIDFHTHAFPDGLAKRATESLRKTVREANMGFDDSMYADGTGGGLALSMESAGVDISVLLPVATKPSQPDSINSWTKSLAKEHPCIIPFGAFYPDDSFEQQLESLAEKGFKGIKLHGEFQGFYCDDERMIRIYRRCGEYDLICVLHSGLDCMSPYDYHVSPVRLARVLDKVSETRFVIAHMGGVCCEDEAAKTLSGAECLWFDTGFAAGRLSPVKMHELIGIYGADKVLFGSDSPWNDPADDIRLIRESGLTSEECEMIFHKNAERLLGLQ